MRGRTIVSASLVILLLAVAVPSLAAPKTRRMSVRSNGTDHVGDSDVPDITPSGRYVVFASSAELIPSDMNTNVDIYLRDQRKKKTRLLSMRSDGSIEPSGNSEHPSISASGRFVVFESSGELIPADGYPGSDIYLRDRKKRKTILVSRRSGGSQGDQGSYTPAISADGRFVAFQTSSKLVGKDTNGAADIYVRNLVKKKTRLVSASASGQVGDGESFDAAISADGRFVAFASNSSDLVPTDGNGAADIFVKDMKTRRIRRVSVRSNGAEGTDPSHNPQISANGRWVVFASESLLAGQDVGAFRNVFVHDRKTRKTRLVSKSSAGATATCASPGSITGLDISPDGRWVAFDSCADNLGNPMGNYSVYLHDRVKGRTRLVSRRNGGGISPDTNEQPAVSKGGLFVAWTSDDEMIVGGDSNTSDDVFRWGPRK
ncbi:MAG TPA: hypothetical protein VF058_03005 [Actinomycetota bacterium]